MTHDVRHDLEVKGLTKSFGPNLVLRGIDLSVRGGEFVGLMGPNGAGKSTLIKILAGVYRASAGEITLGGRAVNSLADSNDVGFIHQDLGLVDALSIADNLRLGEQPLSLWGPILNRAAERSAAEKAIRRVGLTRPVGTLLEELTAGEKTLVAVARVFDRGARILIVDETTSTLPPTEAKRVIQALAAAAESGAAVIMVTHKLSEILDATTRVVVLLDGELVRDEPTAGLDRPALVRMLMQHESAAEVDVKATSADGAGEVLLELVDVGRGEVGPINLELRAGEVIGLSGLPGSGLHDIALLAYGSLRPDEGFIRTPRRSIRRALVPPHRESQGGFGELPVRDNMSVSSLSRWRSFTRLINVKRETLDCQDMAKRLDVRPAAVNTPYETLSGGNKQKVIFARALFKEPDVYVLCEPTRGVDVGTRSEIYRLIRELRSRGAAVLIASSDAEDLFSVCDRVSIVTSGRLQPQRYIADMSASELELMV